MTDDRRIADRRQGARRAEPDPAEPAIEAVLPEAGPAESAPYVSTSRALVRVPPPDALSDIQPGGGGHTPFAAQVLGQGGQKRGLRGGPETLDRARSTYLGTEWSGPADRRPHPGQITKTEI